MLKNRATAFFATRDGQRFVGTDAARGPWSIDACHAGPATGLLARAVEALLPEKRLVRLAAVIQRPIPMAGFRIDTEVERDGRTLATASAQLIDDLGRLCVMASSLHLAARDLGRMPTAAIEHSQRGAAKAGPFPLTGTQHGQACFPDFVEVAYPPGETREPGPTAIWMRAPPLLEGEGPSPFQRLCPLADCGNAISRNAEIAEVSFLNPEISIVCFRAPESDWLASKALSHWESTGIGLATATLFDERGPVAAVHQTLILNRAP